MSKHAMRYSTSNPELPAVCVSASDYDALAQRFQELQEDRQRTADELVAFVRGEHSSVCAERDALRAEVERLRKALAPFAKCAEVFDGSEYAGAFYEWKRRGGEYELTVEDLRSARNAMVNAC